MLCIFLVEVCCIWLYDFEEFCDYGGDVVEVMWFVVCVVEYVCEFCYVDGGGEVVGVDFCDIGGEEDVDVCGFG